MTTATDGAGLLDAILAAPEDDVARLVYADWLEDNGDTQRAEFIRAQIASARGGATQATPCEEHLLYVAANGRAEANVRVWAREAVYLVPGGARYADHVTFRRGFVESVRCTLAEWLKHGPAVVRSQPLTRVELSDKRPLALGGVCAWWRSGDDPYGPPPQDGESLPIHVWEALGIARSINGWKNYESEEAATDALSRALLRVARP